MTQVNSLTQKQKQLQQRLAQQQGRLSESQRQYDSLKEQMERQFGTSDVQKLKAHYQALLAHRQGAIEMRTKLDEYANEALNMIEQDQQVPNTLLTQIEDATQSLKAHVNNAPSFTQNMQPFGSQGETEEKQDSPQDAIGHPQTFAY